ELRLDQAEREARRPDLCDVELPQEVRKAADVILVAVRQDDRPDLAAALPQVAEIRKHEVDPEMLVAREGKARVDDDPLVPDLEAGHVLSALAEAAARDDGAG